MIAFLAQIIEALKDKKEDNKWFGCMVGAVLITQIMVLLFTHFVK